MFDDLTASGWGGETETLVPAVDCFTREKSVVLRVEITLHGGRLLLRGKRESQRKEEDRNFSCQEVSYGRFERLFVLPEAEDLEANSEDGLLEVTFPARELPETKRIPITGGSGTKKQIQAA
jgi:HSP20 family molecular chaperone IbpA